MQIRFSWLDLKLAARMLLKYPALTLVGGLGMAVAIAISAASFAFFYSHLYPVLPLPQGDRLVGLENWDVEENNEARQSLHDFFTWREELRTVQDVAAFRTLGRNLQVPGGAIHQVQIAEMTAGGFRAASVPPLLGRHLEPADELPGAAPVLVVGYDAWRKHLAGDPRIVGRTVRVGSAMHTIVGVMPEGYAFPVSHQFWRPLRARPDDYRRGAGPEMFVFGRLAPGATREQAQAELAALGRRAAAAYPETNARLRPQVLPYTYPIADIQDVTLWQVGMMQLSVSLLLIVVAVNVSVLVYARTASRRGEIAVRTALGASRLRVVGQLFTEALVLSLGAALVGLGLAKLGLRQVNLIMEQEFSGRPFWLDYSVPPATLAWVLGLALLSAVVIGVVPALQATGRRLQVSLREIGSGGGGRMGRTWSLLIVGQVALAVGALPAAAYLVWSQVREVAARPRFAADQFILAALAMDSDQPAGPAGDGVQERSAVRFGMLQTELARRIAAEPQVLGVTTTTAPPGAEPPGSVQVEGIPDPSRTAGHKVRYAHVGADFFDVFGARVLTGRAPRVQDSAGQGSAVIVNRSFVLDVLGGAPALGRRLRYTEGGRREGIEPDEAAPGRWYEIVGVVEDLYARPAGMDATGATVYHALAPGSSGVLLAVRLRSSAQTAFAGRLERLTPGLDPTLRVVGVRSLAAVSRQAQVATRLVALVMGLVTLGVLLLSAAGIYAMMSFTVAARRREIGIRSALGAHPRRLLVGIFARAAGQLGMGVLAGAAAAAVLDRATGGGLMGGRGAILLPGVAAIMVMVGLLAALGPARRGLRIEPTEALRAEA